MSSPSAERRRRAHGVVRALTIAGSDSGGGAGIQADLRTFAARGVHGLSVVTAVTAQDTRGVHAVQAVSPRLVRAQLDAVLGDVGADAIKIGMLFDAATIETVADILERRRPAPIVVDPVMWASGGRRLLQSRGLRPLRARLVPLADVLTPNLAEASALIGRPVRDLSDMCEAGRRLCALGARTVVVTGGHLRGDAVDVLVIGREAQVLRGRRVSGTSPHGTGCTFAAAVAAELAKRGTIPAAVRAAKRYTATCIARAYRIGRGAPVLGPVPRGRC